MEKAFEIELAKWMNDILNPYCLNQCKISCCDCAGAVQIDKGYEPLFETYKLTGKKVPVKEYGEKGSYLFKDKQSGLWHFWGGACPNYDPKNKKCLIHNQYPRCTIYPLIKTKKDKEYILCSVCALHKLQEKEEPLKSLLALCKKHNVNLTKEKVYSS